MSDMPGATAVRYVQTAPNGGANQVILGTRGRGSSSIQVRPACREIGAPAASRNRRCDPIAGRFQVPAIILPSRRIQTLPEPTVMSSGEALPATSRMPVLPIRICMITTLSAFTRLPSVITSGVPFCVRSQVVPFQRHPALASGQLIVAFVAAGAEAGASPYVNSGFGAVRFLRRASPALRTVLVSE